MIRKGIIAPCSRSIGGEVTMSGFVPWECGPAQYSRIVVGEYNESSVNLHVDIGSKCGFLV